MEKIHFKSKLVGKQLRFFTDKNVRSNHIHMNNPVMIDAGEDFKKELQKINLPTRVTLHLFMATMLKLCKYLGSKIK